MDDDAVDARGFTRRAVVIGITGERRSHALDTLAALRGVLPDTPARATWTFHLRSAPVEEVMQAFDPDALRDPRALDRCAPFALSSACGPATRGEAYDALRKCLETTFGASFFLNSLRARIAALEKDTPRARRLVVIVPDVESDEEAAWVAARGGVLIHTLPPREGTQVPLMQFERPTPLFPRELRHFTAREARETLAPDQRDVPARVTSGQLDSFSVHAYDAANSARLRTALRNRLRLDI